MNSYKAKTPLLKLLSVVCAVAITVAAILPSLVGTIIEALTPDLPITVDFEDSNVIINGEISGKKVSGRNGATYNVFSVAEVSGNKALKASVPDYFVGTGNSAWGMVDWDANLWFLNNGSKFVTLEADKTYNISLSYMVYKCDNNASDLASQVGGWRNTLFVGYGTSGDSWGTYGDMVPASTNVKILTGFEKSTLEAGLTDINENTVNVGQWQNVSFDITTVSGANDYRLWICSSALTGTEMYVDNITVTEKVESVSEIKIDFDKKTNGKLTIVNGDIAGQNVSGRNSATYNVFSVAEVSGNKALKASVPDYFVGTGNSAWGMVDWDANLWFVNDGVKFVELKAGKTYTITLKYKLKSCTNNASDLASAVGGWRNTLFVGYGTSGDSWGTYGSIVPASTNIKILTGFEKSSIESGFTDVSGNAVEIGKWNTASVEITPTASANDYRLWVCSSVLTGTELYVDDIVVAEKKAEEPGDDGDDDNLPPIIGTVLDFEKDEDGKNSLSYGTIDGAIIAGYNDSGALNTFALAKEEGNSENNVIKIQTGQKFSSGEQWGTWHKDWGGNIWRINDGKQFLELEADKTYTVSFRYKLVSSSKATDLSPNVGGWRNNLSIGYGTGTGDQYGDFGSIAPLYTYNITVLANYDASDVESGLFADSNATPVTLGQWNTFKTTFKTASDANDYKLWLKATALTGSVLYVDDIKVEEGGIIADDIPVIGEDYPINFELNDNGLNSKAYGQVGGVAVSSYNDSGSGKNAFSIATESDSSSNRVLKAKLGRGFTDPTDSWADWHYGWGRCMWILNNGKKVVELEPGAVYKVSLKYKVVSSGTTDYLCAAQVNRRASLQIGYGRGSEDYGEWGNYSVNSKSQVQTILSNFSQADFANGAVFKDSNNTVVKLGEWNTYECLIPVIEGKDHYELFIAFSALYGTEIHFDDIVVTKTDLVPDVDVVDFESSYTEGITKITKEDYTFNLASFINKKGQVNHGEEIVFNPDGVRSGFASLLVDSSKAFRADVLLRNAVNPNGWKTNPGERYAITFYYKAGNGNPGGMVVETVQAPNTYNGWIDFESVDAGYYELSSCTSSDGWKQGTIIFENRTKVAQYIIFQVNCGIADQPNATVYFDDISVKKLTDEQIYVAFDYRDGRNTSYKIGAVGEALVIPTPTREGYTFDGWYTDAAYTKKFTGTTVPDKSMIVYAKWNINRGQTVTVDFENYDYTLPKSCSITTETAASGKKSLKFVRGEQGKTGEDYVYLQFGKELVTVNPGQKYAVSLDYRIDVAPYSGEEQLNIYMKTCRSDANNDLAFNQKFDSTKGGLWVPTHVRTGQWLQFSDIIEVEETENSYVLAIKIGQGPLVQGYIDNITITQVYDDQGVVLVNNDAGGNIPYYIGKIGTSTTLKTPKRAGDYLFKGFCADAKLANTITSVEFKEEEQRVYAKWILVKFGEDFENYEGLPGAYCLGSDYELYNSSVKGFNPANVHGGTTSLHRKGDKHVFQVAQVINSKYTLTANTMYTISFYVKMDKSLHKDGAVQIASALSYFTLSPSAISGEWQNVISIEDLSDGEWHKVSYTFCSFGVGLFIRTPGYCSIYIDDIVFEYAGDNATVSQQATVKNEYVPVLRNADGSLVNQKLIVTDPSLANLEPIISNDSDNIKDTDSNIILYIIIIAAAVIVIAAAVTVTLVIIKRKRRGVI